MFSQPCIFSRHAHPSFDDIKRASPPDLKKARLIPDGGRRQYRRRI
jgi:hypothetical protein